MTPLLTHFASDSSSGIGALGVDGKAFLIQLITFVLAYIVLRKWAFGPILRVMRERRETIESGVKLGEQMRREKSELDNKVDKLLHEARQQADSIVAEATEAGRQTVREAEDNARVKAEGIVKDAHARAEQEVRRARKQLEKEVVALVSDATEVIIGEKVDATKDAALIDKALRGRQAA